MPLMTICSYDVTILILSLMSLLHRSKIWSMVSVPKKRKKRRKRKGTLLCWSFSHCLFPIGACSLELCQWYVKQKILLVSLLHRSTANKHIRYRAELKEHLLLDAPFCAGLMLCPCMYHLERGRKELFKNKNSWFRFKFSFCAAKCREGKWKGVICCDHWIGKALQMAAGRLLTHESSPSTVWEKSSAHLPTQQQQCSSI